MRRRRLGCSGYRGHPAPAPPASPPCPAASAPEGTGSRHHRRPKRWRRGTRPPRRAVGSRPPTAPDLIPRLDPAPRATYVLWPRGLGARLINLAAGPPAGCGTLGSTSSRSRAVLRAGAAATGGEEEEHTWETVPFFDGFMTGEFRWAHRSFAGVPELHHPVRGRIRGVRAFEAYATRLRRGLASATCPSKMSSSRGRLMKLGREWCPTSTVTSNALAFRSGSSPTSSPTDAVHELRVLLQQLAARPATTRVARPRAANIRSSARQTW